MTGRDVAWRIVRGVLGGFAATALWFYIAHLRYQCGFYRRTLLESWRAAEPAPGEPGESMADWWRAMREREAAMIEQWRDVTDGA